MIRALLLLLLASPLAAQSDPTVAAGRASAMLEAASMALTDADGARDRVAALTETIRAFEEGQVAVREALRRVGMREAALTQDLASERRRLAALLGAAQAIEQAPVPLLLLHPNGPLGTARSAMILSDVAPALSAEFVALRAQLEELQALRVIQEQARADLARALQEAQTARAELSQAIADRTDLPPRIETDADAMAALNAAAGSLDTLTAALRAAPPPPVPEADRIAGARGGVPLPAFGTLLRRFNEADAAGISRPGMILATRPRALVTAPWSGAIRYAGAVPGYGNVILLEPDPQHLIVMAGLGELLVATGVLLSQGEAIGLMGGPPVTSENLITATQEDYGLSLSETLYIEVRVDETPVDPVEWFRVRRDEE
ncbi:MAG: peptidoglycan DD-metalloendopeptidase family protein [Pseudomonadota bacterium]